MSTRNPKPPPEISGGVVVDLISHLPDAILTTIISLFPFKEGARTALISPRYRHLWSSSTLDLSVSSLLTFASRDEVQRVIAAVDRILTVSHSGPVRSFTLSHLPFSSIEGRIDRWLETLAQRGIRKLHFCNFGEHRVLPPCSLFGAANPSTCPLQDLKFRSCAPREIISFPKLRVLSFEYVRLSDESLVGLLSGCPLLEDLSVHFCELLRKIRICSRSLRLFALEVFAGAGVDSIVVEDVPNLQWLMLGQYVTRVTHVRILNAPKLETLGFVNVGVKGIELVQVLEFITIFARSKSKFLQLMTQRMLAKNVPVENVPKRVAAKNVPSRMWAETLHVLCLENRASAKAQVVFTE